MSTFRDFDNLRNQVNRMMANFDSGLRGHTHGFGGGLGGSDEMMDFPFGGSQWSTGGGHQQAGWNTPLMLGGEYEDVGSSQPTEEGKQVGLPSQQQMHHQMQRRPSRLLHSISSSGPQAGTLQPTFQPNQFLQARINLEDQKDKYIVTAEMPGFSKANIKVNVTDDGFLHLRAEQKKEHIEESKDKRYIKAERCFTNLERRLRLPKDTDVSKVAASYENGILHVNLPKVPAAEQKQQEIAIA